MEASHVVIPDKAGTMDLCVWLESDRTEIDQILGIRSISVEQQAGLAKRLL